MSFFVYRFSFFSTTCSFVHERNPRLSKINITWRLNHVIHLKIISNSEFIALFYCGHLFAVKCNMSTIFFLERDIQRQRFQRKA